jgi:hypothetical protein
MKRNTLNWIVAVSSVVMGLYYLRELLKKPKTP